MLGYEPAAPICSNVMVPPCEAGSRSPDTKAAGPRSPADPVDASTGELIDPSTAPPLDSFAGGAPSFASCEGAVPASAGDTGGVAECGADGDPEEHAHSDAAIH